MDHIRHQNNAFSFSSKEELIMLTMLHQARYGTEMMEMIWDASDGKVNIDFGSFYPICKKLVKHELIVKTEDPHPEENLKERNGHLRKYYMLTEKGREALQKVYKLRSTLRDMDGRQEALT